MNQLLTYFSLLLLSIIVLACNSENVSKKNIVETILTEKNSYYYVDVENYPTENRSLPVGVFDSGTGGLTVLDAILNYDKFDNGLNTFLPKGDNKRDFDREGFVYFGDHANMPYGEYEANKNTALLKEHVIKDVQFLLGNKYYQSPASKNYMNDKSQVKAIVIACNTATAFGKKDIEKFLEKAKLNIKVIGVIGAGVRGALSTINKSEDASIAVMATAGTVSSMGYVESINEQKVLLAYSGNLVVFQQAGIGLAGAIDGAKDYILNNASIPRTDYRGPSFNHSAAKINKKILRRYNFDFAGSKMLFAGSLENPDELQINSIENYISYHVVSLMEQILTNKNAPLLKTVILGCTHYPFYSDLFEKKFTELYNYKENGEYIYRKYMSEKINFIDPAENTSKELYEYLYSNNLFTDISNPNHEFYISQPNVLNESVTINEAGDFTYDYKYGRKPGNITEYVKCIPFSKKNLSQDVIEMLSTKTPLTFKYIVDFNRNNKKTQYLLEEEKL